MASGVQAQQKRLEAIMQMTCRDRNRLAMQADNPRRLRAASGTPVPDRRPHELRQPPAGQGVHDLRRHQPDQDVQGHARRAKFQCGDEMAVSPELYIGCAENPFGDPFEVPRPALKKKVEAGADFMQTQASSNVPKFKSGWKSARHRLHKEVKIWPASPPSRAPAWPST